MVFPPCVFTHHCFSWCLRGSYGAGHCHVSVGSQSRLFWQLFCKVAVRRERVTKQSPLSVSSALQKAGLASECVWQTSFFPLSQPLLDQSRNCQWIGAVGTVDLCYSLSSEVSQLLSMVCSPLEQIANSLCDSLRIMRINLTFGEGADCVCIWQPTSLCSWDCLRHSMEMRGPYWQGNTHFVWGAAELCQLLPAWTLSKMASLPKPLDVTEVNVRSLQFISSPCHLIRDPNAKCLQTLRKLKSPFKTRQKI